MTSPSTWSGLLGAAVHTLGASARRMRQLATPPRTRVTPRAGSAPSSRGRTAYPGDFRGAVRPAYSPSLDGDADPGEIVWAWVPYEEDASRGKDRPVLIVGRDGSWLLGLMLTSKDHSRDAEDESLNGRTWMDVGSGAWDAQRRPSEVRLDRVLRIDPGAVRREGAVMGRDVFDLIAAWLRGQQGW